MASVKLRETSCFFHRTYTLNAMLSLRSFIRSVVRSFLPFKTIFASCLFVCWPLFANRFLFPRSLFLLFLLFLYFVVHSFFVLVCTFRYLFACNCGFSRCFFTCLIFRFVFVRFFCILFLILYISSRCAATSF